MCISFCLLPYLLSWQSGLFLPPFSWLAHLLQGERKPSAGEAEYIEPLLEELCTRSGVSRNTLTLRMRTDEDINAFASGINHITIIQAL